MAGAAPDPARRARTGGARSGRTGRSVTVVLSAGSRKGPPMTTVKEFEAAVLKAWVDTAVPLTRANLQEMTGCPRKDVESFMSQLLLAGVVDMDVGADGEAEWKVRGAKRRPQGPVEAKAALNLVLAGQSALKALEPSKGQKSVLMSGGLSLLLGPFGWLYAGPFREAIPAILIYVALVTVMPWFLIGILLGLLHAASGLVGVVYAWKFNEKRRRVPLLLKGTRTRSIEREE